jgi:transcriptional regulator GlxA family with amidase domain
MALPHRGAGTPPRMSLTYVSERLIGSGGAATLSIVSDVDVAVLAVDGCFDSGLSAVLDVLATANALRQNVPAPPAAFNVKIVGLKRHVRTGNGLIVNPVLANKLAQRPDLLVMPALGVKTPAEIVDTVHGHAALDLIRDSHANGTELAGACTGGTFFLAESGVLDGRLATTSWWLGPAFRNQYPAVRLDETRTIAQDARITTAGAAFAHIDLALSIVQQHSPSLADLTARYLLIGDPPSQAAFAVPAMLARTDPTMAAFEKWVRQRLPEPLQISAAARDLGISERTLQRTTATVVGMSPVHFIQQVRLDEATFLLRDTSMSASAIAAAVGYRNAGTLRALVRKRRNSTLGALRSGRPAGRL